MMKRCTKSAIGAQVFGAFLVAFGCLGLTSCTATTTAGANQVRYFATFSGEANPTTPIGEITLEETGKWRAYYVATYDAAGRVITVEKMLDGKRSSLWEYRYHANGALASARITDHEGKTTVLNYSERGSDDDAL